MLAVRISALDPNATTTSRTACGASAKSGIDIPPILLGGAPKVCIDALADRHDEGQGGFQRTEALGASALQDTVARGA